MSGHDDDASDSDATLAYDLSDVALDPDLGAASESDAIPSYDPSDLSLDPDLDDLDLDEPIIDDCEDNPNTADDDCTEHVEDDPFTFDPDSTCQRCGAHEPELIDWNDNHGFVCVYCRDELDKAIEEAEDKLDNAIAAGLLSSPEHEEDHHDDASEPASKRQRL